VSTEAAGAGFDCTLVQQLIGRYHDGELAGERADAFEQHLLQCPPCLVEVRRLRATLRYLDEAAAAVGPAGVVERLSPAGRGGGDGS
jgi:anti-sigma factor RsiW